MSKNRAARLAKAFEDIERLKASRRKDIIKCAAALAAIALVLGGKFYLESNGLVEPGNMMVGALTMFSAIGLAILGGTSSLDFTRCGNQILDIRARTNISKQDITDYERGTR